MAYEQIADLEEGDLSDFNTAAPAWDAEVDAVADFDAEADADNDMNDHADAAHDGVVGLELTLDDNNAMYGTMNADAVDQTSGVVSLWLNLHDAAIGSGEYIELLRARDGANANNWRLVLYNDGGGGVKLKGDARNDAAGYDGAYGAVLATGWNHILFMWEQSSGADDGYHYVYVNGTLYTSTTGIDNDTKDYDYIWVGMIATGGFASPSGSYYIDTIKLDPIGGPFASKLAVKNGSYGMALPIIEATPRYVDFTGPTDETIVTMDFWFDPNSMPMGGSYILLRCYGSGAGNDPVGYYISKSGSNYVLTMFYDHDTGSEQRAGVTITDDWHRIRIVWVASSAPGEDDGFISLFVDGVLEDSVTGIDNDGHDLDTIRFGAIASIDAGTYGMHYIDDFQWDDAGNYLYTGDGAITPTGAETKKTAKPLAGAISSIVGGFARTLPGRAFAGAITPAGTVVKKAAKTFDGGMYYLSEVMTGTVTKKVGKVLAGALTPAGDLLERLLRTCIAYFRKSPSGHVQIMTTNDTGVVYIDTTPGDKIEE